MYIHYIDLEILMWDLSFKLILTCPRLTNAGPPQLHLSMHIVDDVVAI